MSPKVILITGATAGIGRHTALTLARAGHHVIATGRRTDALDALRTEASGLHLDTLRLDVTDQASVDAAVAEVDRLTAGHGVDALVNNAGYGQVGAVLDVPDAAVLAQFDTNVHGLLRVTRAFASAMIRRGSGRIVNISSVGGRTTLPMAGVYNATKYAVESLSDALRMELRPHGIGVSVIEPGAVRTEFGDTAAASVTQHVPKGSPWSPVYDLLQAVLARYEANAPGPASVAAAIQHAIEARSPRSRYVAPAYNRIFLALAAILPTRLVDAVLAWPLGLSAARLRPAMAALPNHQAASAVGGA